MNGPSQGPTYNELNAVAALSPNDIWVVGDMSDSRYYGSRVLIEHWDGKHWHTAMPDLPGGLCSISALSPDDIWAVGAGPGCGYSLHLLTLHWDGKHWQQFSAPLPNTQNKVGILASVVALAPDNVWAVGSISREALIEHWNGHSWVIIPQPFQGLESALNAIAAHAANDIWAVGSARETMGADLSLAEHWDGRSWKVVPMPGFVQDNRLFGFPGFNGLATLSHNQLLAVGSIGLSSVFGPTPLIERWTGTQWQFAFGTAPAHPNLGTPQASLQAIVTLNPQDAWAVGNAAKPDHTTIGYALVYHWDGQSWQQVKAPSFMFGSTLNAISAITASDIWAVGSTESEIGNGDSVILIEHWNGTTWQGVPGLNPGTPAPPMGTG